MTTFPKRYALLIGIDFYFAGEKRVVDGSPVRYSRLKGCVKDVKDIEKSLKELFKDDEGCDIRMLTASAVADSNAPTEADMRTWPTHENIVRELNQLNDDLQDGDLVYIHYSGHGIRRKPPQIDDEGDFGAGTALAPMDVALGGAYITGYHLGVLVKKMFQVRENLRVVLVLDSCFSGAGLRGNDVYDDSNTYLAARRPDLDCDETVLESDELFDKAIQNAEAFMDDGYRGAIPQHLSANDIPGCAVITACAIDETAFEYKFAGETGANGVLTFWLLNCLRHHHSKGTATYMKVREHVIDKIISMRPTIRHQVPVLYGDDFYEFFSHKKHYERPDCRVIGRDGTVVQLDIGKSEGLFNGAIYDIYSEEFSIREACQKDITDHRIAQVRIENALDFRSHASVVRGSTSASNIERNCRAVLDTWALSSSMYISIGIPEVDFRDELAKLVQKQPGLHLCPEHSMLGAIFNVSVDEGGYFEVRDNNDCRLARVPMISILDDGAVEKLAFLLRHLARFHDIKYLQSTNTLSPIASMPFTFELLSQTGECIPKGLSGKYEIEEGEEFIISFTNKNTARPVYVTFICLTATWGIEKLCPLDGSRGIKTLENEPVKDLLSMCVPPRTRPDDPSGIDDILRACIYYGNDPPSWNGLMLPDLPSQASLVQSDEALEAVLVPTEEKDRNPNRDVTKMKFKNMSGKINDGGWAFIDIVVHTLPDSTSHILE